MLRHLGVHVLFIGLVCIPASKEIIGTCAICRTGVCAACQPCTALKTGLCAPCWTLHANGTHCLPSCQDHGCWAIAHATTLANYTAKDDTELSFHKGQTIEVLDKDGPRWFGTLNDMEGYFPAELVRAVSPRTPYKFERSLAPTWAADDRVEVFYAKLVLANWRIPGRQRPWQTYHAAVGFVNNATGEKVLFEHVPLPIDDSMTILFPTPTMPTWTPRWSIDRLPFEFNKEAYIKFANVWPEHFTRFVRVAVANGTVYNRYLEWVDGVAAPRLTTFDPDNMLERPLGDQSWLWRVKAQTCMEFADMSLRALHDAGADVNFSKPIGKDMNVFHTKRITVVDEDNLANCPRCGRELLRAFRLLQTSFFGETSLEFHHFRGKLAIFFKAGLPLFVSSRNVTYRIEMVPPFVNHCRTAASHPAEEDLAFDPTHCALPVGMPFLPPDRLSLLGALVVAEERLDRPDVFAALFLSAFLAVVLSFLFPSSAADSEQHVQVKKQVAGAEPHSPAKKAIEIAGCKASKPIPVGASALDGSARARMSTPRQVASATARVAKSAPLPVTSSE